MKTAIVLLAVPFSLIGAVWLLWLLGYNVSIAVWVGMIALMGLDAETGVFMLLFLDLAYDERRARRHAAQRAPTCDEAIVHGAVKRVRPKMMTVAAAFMGLLPIMWSHGRRRRRDEAHRRADGRRARDVVRARAAGLSGAVRALAVAGAAVACYAALVPARLMDATAMSRVIARLRRRAPGWNTTALAAISQATGRDPFRILIGCLLSLRTKDDTTAGASARLFALASTPAGILALSTDAIERAIYPVGFYRTKARVLHRVCRDLLDRFDGQVPSDLDALLTLHGVGRKTANLVVTFGFELPGICVDTHVHRITNRLGFVRTRTPEQTEMALRRRLPPRHWIALNDLLVAFGQNLCHPTSPHCSICPVVAACGRVGVRQSR